MSKRVGYPTPALTDFRVAGDALLSGGRYGELAAMTVDDFNRDGTPWVRISKRGKPCHDVLIFRTSRSEAGQQTVVASIKNLVSRLVSAAKSRRARISGSSNAQSARLSASGMASPTSKR
jgi:integrase